MPQEPDTRPTTQRVGGGMIVMAWLGITMLLVLTFSGMLEKQKNPNREVVGRVTEQGVREIVLRRNRSGHYVATGSINRNAVNFLLDTGATQVAIPGDLAQRLGLPRGLPVRVHTANGEARGYQTVLETLSLGAITFTNVAGIVTPAMTGDEVLLGMNLLSTLELVQRGRELTLRQH